jgi:hypothetical protein
MPVELPLPDLAAEAGRAVVTVSAAAASTVLPAMAVRGRMRGRLVAM